jgi:hypothetical protein
MQILENIIISNLYILLLISHNREKKTMIRSSSLSLAACYFTWSCCFLLKTHLECMPSACCFFQLNNVYNSVVRMFNICYISTHICTKYRIMAVLNVETAIIWGSGAALLEQALIPVIMIHGVY